MIECPKCHFKEQDGMSFCSHCGTKLSVKCSHCAVVNPITNTFCSNCGYKLSAPKTAEDPNNESQIVVPQAESNAGSVVKKGNKDRFVNAFQWVAFGLIIFTIVLTLSLFFFQWIHLPSSSGFNPPHYLRTIYSNAGSRSVTFIDLFTNFGSVSSLEPAVTSAAHTIMITNIIGAFLTIGATVFLTVRFILQVAKKDFSLLKFRNSMIFYSLSLLVISGLTTFNGYSLVVPTTLSTFVMLLLVVVCFILNFEKTKTSTMVLSILAFVGTIILLGDLTNIGASTNYTSFHGIGFLFGLTEFLTTSYPSSAGDHSGLMISLAVLLSLVFILAFISLIIYVFYINEVLRNPQKITKKLNILTVILIALTFVGFILYQAYNIQAQQLAYPEPLALSPLNFGILAYTPFLILIIGILNLVSIIRKSKSESSVSSK